ncbi:MAG: hypothetical protein NC908_01555 [Candidatus Omnitrophica bacterium]|nr:hypothetical protein [Candidatus Omnitrophota bacterium]
MKTRISAIVLLILFFSVSDTCAAWMKKPELRWRQLYRYDLRQDNHKLYTNYISAGFSLGRNNEAPFKIIPFFEARRNINRELWEAKVLGVEVGRDIFSWLYIGESFKWSWINEDRRNYAVYEKDDSALIQTRLILSHRLLSNRYINLKGFICEEHTFDFEKAGGILNEVSIGLINPVGKYIEIGINWRHIDRIHYYDSDTFEFSTSIVF